MSEQETKQNQKMKYTACTFRNRYSENDISEFVTFSSYSYSLIEVLKDVETFIKTTKYGHHSLYINFNDGEFYSISFDSDEKFFNFKKKVEDARLDDYKEWMLSYYKDGATKGLPDGNREGS
jgi:hypothetical protein